MAYAAPTIDSTGLHIPSYKDTLDDLINQMKAIFGQDIYLGNDSADYQMLSIFARKFYDVLLSAQLVYNNRGPLTAIGTGLDGIIKLNGLTRKTPSYSTCELTLTGTPETVIKNGIAQDINGYKWDLPAEVAIGEGGSATVSATCETIGEIRATEGDISIIGTPTRGWISVTNLVPAVCGQPVERDSQVRSRQAVSTTLPSQTMLDKTIAAIASLSGVARYKVFENPTGAPETDPNGLNLPGHSITCVVEGDTDANVANAIYENRGIGPYTNGNVSVTLESPSGTATTIRFFRPVYVPIFVAIGVKPLPGFANPLVPENIRTSVTNYLNSLQIYEEVTQSGLYGAALSAMTNLALPTFSIRSLRLGLSADPTGTNDLAIAFNAVAEGLADNIAVEVLS